MNKIMTNLGLCNRARGTIIGEHLTVEAIRTSKCIYVFLANDAGINTQKKIKDKALFYNVEVNDEFSSLELSNAIGKENIKVVGITIKNKGFIKLFRK